MGWRWAGAWTPVCGPRCAGAGEQPRKGGELSHTLAAGRVLPGIEGMIWLRVHCLLSFAQCCPLNWSLRGTVLRQIEWIFAELVKFTYKLGSLGSMKPPHSPNPAAGEF